jgi:uncharacterized protein YqgC (DUF456 family)
VIHFIFIAAVLLLIGVGILMVPLSLPGTWLIAGLALFYSFFFSFDGGSTSAFWVLGWLFGLALFGEIIELLVGTFGGKAVKVSNGAILASFIGSVAGLVLGAPIFLVGSLVGLFIGAFLGAFLYEWWVEKSVKSALRTAAAVLASRIVATFLKTGLAIGMGIFLGYKIF